MRTLVKLAISIVAGFFLMAPLASLAEMNHWPYFQTWGLAHGSFIVAWPALSLLSYGVVHLADRYVRWRLE
ncbi:MAG TPA: hypothetical protein VGA40_03875 [Candidatus Acidoferrales bacterium]